MTAHSDHALDEVMTDLRFGRCPLEPDPDPVLGSLADAALTYFRGLTSPPNVAPSYPGAARSWIHVEPVREPAPCPVVASSSPRAAAGHASTPLDDETRPARTRDGS